MADAPDALWSASISPGAKMIGALLWTYASHGDAQPFVWPATKTLADKTGQSRSGVSRQLAELMAGGLIRRTSRPIGGRSQFGWVLYRGSTMVDTSVHDGGTKTRSDVHDGGHPCPPRWKEMSTMVEGDVHHGGTEAPLIPHEAPLKPQGQKAAASVGRPKRHPTLASVLEDTSPDGRTYREVFAEAAPLVDIDDECADAWDHKARLKRGDMPRYLRKWLKRAQADAAAQRRRDDRWGATSGRYEAETEYVPDYSALEKELSS